MNEPKPDEELNFDTPKVATNNYSKPKVSVFDNSIDTKQLLPSVQLEDISDILDTSKSNNNL